MRHFFLTACIFLTSLSAIAGDDWSERNVSSSETIYKSGYEQVLLIGNRGFGFMYSLPTAVDLMGDEVTLTIDGGASEVFKSSKIVANTILISPSQEVAKRVANAKKIELTYRMCPPNIDGCSFSYRGGINKSKWEFERPLSETFKNYQEKISIKAAP